MEDFLSQSHQKKGTTLLNELFWKCFRLKMLVMIVVLLICYSDKKIIQGILGKYLVFEIDSDLWKCLIFENYDLIGLQDLQNVFEYVHWNLKIEFHTTHWEIPQLSP
jgi:hypothetical protein